MSLLLTDNASSRSSDGMMPGFLMEEGGGMEKLVIVALAQTVLQMGMTNYQQLRILYPTKHGYKLRTFPLHTL